MSQQVSGRFPETGREGRRKVFNMDKKMKSPFAATPGLVDPKKKKEKRLSAEGKRDLKKTSADPLYDTTDRYRKVCKPMDVDDFLSKEH